MRELILIAILIMLSEILTATWITIMGLFDLLLLGTPTIGALVLIAGSLVSGARTRSWLFIIPAIPGILVGVVMLDQFLSYPNGSPTGCLSAGFWLVIGVVAYLIVNRRAQKKQPNP